MKNKVIYLLLILSGPVFFLVLFDILILIELVGMSLMLKVTFCYYMDRLKNIFYIARSKLFRTKDS
ncbi:hypothetical protein A9267_21060 [Shewanella sp. UCD-FRSSP16_17]|nr:hypothetical protein A9267_21060 [Shewanella sp. UCD-FRSSP16_17]